MSEAEIDLVWRLSGECCGECQNKARLRYHEEIEEALAAELRGDEAARWCRAQRRMKEDAMLAEEGGMVG
ncbi:MAG TPA: hypothetical protein VJP77_05510 [Planctomycetota bacterium]|nr:hypothetical protein [Planctomycetota bacterium]